MSTRVSAYGRENDGRGQPSLLTQLSVLLFSFFFGNKGGGGRRNCRPTPHHHHNCAASSLPSLSRTGLTEFSFLSDTVSQFSRRATPSKPRQSNMAISLNTNQKE